MIAAKLMGPIALIVITNHHPTFGEPETMNSEQAIRLIEECDCEAIHDLYRIRIYRGGAYLGFVELDNKNCCEQSAIMRLIVENN